MFLFGENTQVDREADRAEAASMGIEIQESKTEKSSRFNLSTAVDIEAERRKWREMQEGGARSEETSDEAPEIKDPWAEGTLKDPWMQGKTTFGAQNLLGGSFGSAFGSTFGVGFGGMADKNSSLAGFGSSEASGWGPDSPEKSPARQTSSNQQQASQSLKSMLGLGNADISSKPATSNPTAELKNLLGIKIGAKTTAPAASLSTETGSKSHKALENEEDAGDDIILFKPREDAEAPANASQSPQDSSAAAASKKISVESLFAGSKKISTTSNSSKVTHPGAIKASDLMNMLKGNKMPPKPAGAVLSEGELVSKLAKSATISNPPPPVIPESQKISNVASGPPQIPESQRSSKIASGPPAIPESQKSSNIAPGPPVIPDSQKSSRIASTGGNGGDMMARMLAKAKQQRAQVPAFYIHTLELTCTAHYFRA